MQIDSIVEINHTSLIWADDIIYLQDNKVDIYSADLEPKLNFLLALLGEYNF